MDKKVLSVTYAVAAVLLLILVFLVVKSNRYWNDKNSTSSSTQGPTLTEAEKDKILSSLETRSPNVFVQPNFDNSAPALVNQKQEQVILKSLKTSIKPVLTAKQRQNILQSLTSSN